MPDIELKQKYLRVRYRAVRSSMMSLKTGLFLILCLTTAVLLCNGERVRYDNYRVTHREAYKYSSRANKKFFSWQNETKELLEENVQKAIDKDYEQVATGRAILNRWRKYQTLDSNYNWLVGLARSYPGVVTVIEGGKSYEKRSILGVKISYNNGSKQKPGIFLEAGIHAREWIAPATATYVINELLTSSDEEVKEIAQNYDWYVFPHANPDGYVYTHTTDRMWRKTRQPHGTCYGADPNRNWNVFWNTVGTSSEPCSNIRGKCSEFRNRNFEQVYNVTVKALNKRYETVYTGGNIYDAIYPAAGSSVDFAYTKLGIRMAFCFELRPNGSFNGNGMELPADQIQPTAAELLDGLVAMVDLALGAQAQE
ncbi:unnamed protein product [Ceratitis capitata]|uniref:(Mediterranean fruit fly) hypothetical protein n=1 Tax=Ceratitis capitata TaxID=7213 RepID=A0A811UKB4_CERCA|nr:unnamed protein product [Ceratitis capitata]